MNHFGSNPVGLYEKALPASLSWEERLNQVAQSGFSFIEISIDDSDDRLARLEWTTDDRIQLRRLSEDRGIPILTMGVSGHRKFPLGSSSFEKRQRGLDILEKAIQLASDLGTRIIQLMGYDVYDQPSDSDTQARFLEGLHQGVRWASRAGVMLAIENVDVETTDSLEKTLRFIREVNSPWLNLYPDMGNLVAAGFSPVEQLKLAKEYLVGIHVKDAIPGVVRGVVFGEGDCPFMDVFRTLSDLDYFGPMVVEMWAHMDATGDPLGSVISARQFVNQFLKNHKSY